MNPTSPPDPEEMGRNTPPSPDAPPHETAPVSSPSFAGEDDGEAPQEMPAGAAPERRFPWGLAVLLVVFSFLANLTATTSLAILLNVPRNPRIELLLISQFAGHAVGAWVAVRGLLMIQRTTHLKGRSLGIALSGGIGSRIGHGLRIYLLALPGFILVSSLFMALSEQFGINVQQPTIQRVIKQVFGNPGAIALFFLIAAVGAPLWEELVFRGLLYPAARARFGVWAAAIFTAFAFALLHETMRVIHDPRTFLLPIFYLGVVLAIIRERTESVVPCMIVHAVHNGITLAVTFTFGPGMPP
ncbi:MAG: CPBP family intramembrane metalloprotease [Armatimonadetes bacterium]|nr:CPBP family intramembrane metalloprotease [Armatimonadota bacterium]